MRTNLKIIKQRKTIFIASALMSLILFTASALAQQYSPFYGFENNEIVMLVLFLLLFFAIIFGVLGTGIPAFKENTAVRASISFILAILMSVGLYYKGFFGLTLVNAAIIVGSLVILIFLFRAFAKASKSQMGLGGVFILFGLFFIILKFMPKFSPDPYAMPQWFFNFAEWSFIIGIILCIVGIILFIARKGR